MKTASPTTSIHYLAYGSNLHPLRLRLRVPSARSLGVVALPGRRLAFHKRSLDGSGKCLWYPAPGEADAVYGVLYEFAAAEKAALDAAEGSGKGYAERREEVSLGGVTYRAYLYVAEPTHVDATLVPFDWYRRLVLAGARHHALPERYIAMIAATPARPDPDPARRQTNEALLAQMERT